MWSYVASPTASDVQGESTEAGISKPRISSSGREAHRHFPGRAKQQDNKKVLLLARLESL